MTKRLYNIGEFAAINKITARMLRHYDKIGLLKPAMIAENGYRAYSSEQINLAGFIKKYRDCEFSLTEIKALLCADEEEIKRFAASKAQQLQQQALASVSIAERLNMLSGIESSIFENHYELSFTERAAQHFVYLREPIAENGIEKALDKLCGILNQQSIIPCGLLMLLSDFSENPMYRAAVPIKGSFAIEGLEHIVLASGQYLSTIHYGDYYGIAAAYDKLLSYLGMQGKQPEPPLIERYFLDRTHIANAAQYITEVSIKITP